jgi:hypothetical protein
MAKNVVKAKVEVPGEKLERFQHLDKNLRELQAEYRKVKDEIVGIGRKIRSTPGWLARSAQIGRPQATPIKAVPDAVKAKLTGIVDVPDPEPIAINEGEFERVRKRAKDLDAEAETILSACGILLHERFDSMLQASSEECARLAPQDDLVKERVVSAVVELASAMMDADQFYKSNCSDRNLTWEPLKALPLNLFDNFLQSAPIFLDCASELEIDGADRTFAQRLREYVPFREVPQRRSDHPKLNGRGGGFSRSHTQNNGGQSAEPLKLAASGGRHSLVFALGRKGK